MKRLLLSLLAPALLFGQSVTLDSEWDSSAEIAANVSDETGSGALVFANSPTLVTPALGTPSAIVLTNGTGLPVATGISGLGSGVATALATPSSANLRSAVTDESGTGNLLFQGGILNDSITNLSSGTALTINTLYYDTFSAARTFTISGSPTEGSFIEVFATMSADVTLTFPTVNRLLNESAAAAAVLYPVGFHKISLEYRNSAWWLIDSGGPLNNLAATGAPAVTNDVDEGYGVGSLWIDVSNDNSYICSDNTDGAAVWTQIDAAGSSNIVDDTTPQLGGQLDVNGNAIGDGTRELLTFTEDGSAVNQVNIENEATGSGPIVSAAGDDTNIDLLLRGKGTGAVDAPVKTFTEIHATSHTLTASECYGAVYYVSASGVTLTLPAVAEGMSITVISNTANTVIVDANASDLIILDGTALDDGDSIDSGGTAGEVVVLTYYNSTGWFATSDGWTDGGAS